MYVVTNKSGINGASSMLYEDKLFELATKLDSDLYIMPSSIHETICVSTSMGNPEELAAMVAEVNMTNVELNERLSNQVYFYDKDLRKLTMATDTPNKRLDGIVAEAPMLYESTESLKMVREVKLHGFILMNFMFCLIRSTLQNICSSCGKR